MWVVIGQVALGVVVVGSVSQWNAFEFYGRCRVGSIGLEIVFRDDVI
jgi:hypothetical protein